MQNGKDIEQTLGDDNKNLHKIQKYKTISNISIVGLFVFFFQISISNLTLLFSLTTESPGMTF